MLIPHPLHGRLSHWAENLPQAASWERGCECQRRSDPFGRKRRGLGCLPWPPPRLWCLLLQQGRALVQRLHLSVVVKVLVVSYFSVVAPHQGPNQSQNFGTGFCVPLYAGVGFCVLETKNVKITIKG